MHHNTQPKPQTMKTTTDAKALASALATVVPFADPGGFLPIVKTVRIEVTAVGGIVLTASDTLAWITDTIDGSSTDFAPGAVCVDAASLFSAVRTASPGDVSLSRNPNKPLIVEFAEGGTFSLAAMPDDDFPSQPTASNGDQVIEIDPEFFAALDRVLSAVPSKDPRQALVGVHLVARGDRLALEGTDGKRLIRTSVPVDHPYGDGLDRDVIIPRDTAAKVAKLASPVAVHLAFTERGVEFTIGYTRIYSNLVAAQFPNVDAVVPKSFGLEWEVATVDLVRNIKRALVVADDNENIDLAFEDGGCVGISARGSERGDFSTAIPAKSTNGDGFGAVRFAAGILQSVVARAGESVTICGNNKTGPFVFKSSERPDDTLLAMPIKVTAPDREAVAA